MQKSHFILTEMEFCHNFKCFRSPRENNQNVKWEDLFFGKVHYLSIPNKNTSESRF